MSLFTEEENEQLLEDLAGDVVVKGVQTTHGRLRLAPLTLQRGQEGSAGVLTADASVLIALGTLDGITASKGIDQVITVNGDAYTVIDIVTPESEPDGDMLELVLRKN